MKLVLFQMGVFICLKIKLNTEDNKMKSFIFEQYITSISTFLIYTFYIQWTIDVSCDYEHAVFIFNTHLTQVLI